MDPFIVGHLQIPLSRLPSSHMFGRAKIGIVMRLGVLTTHRRTTLEDVIFVGAKATMLWGFTIEIVSLVGVVHQDHATIAKESLLHFLVLDDQRLAIFSGQLETSIGVLSCTFRVLRMRHPNSLLFDIVGQLRAVLQCHFTPDEFGLCLAFGVGQVNGATGEEDGVALWHGPVFQDSPLCVGHGVLRIAWNAALSMLVNFHAFILGERKVRFCDFRYGEGGARRPLYKT